MRELRWTALVAAVTVIGPSGTGYRLAPSGSRPMTIIGMSYLFNYSPSEKVNVWRGKPADIDVLGQLVDLSTGVEVKTLSDGAASGISASITDRVHGLSSQIKVHLSASASAAAGTYKVLIHYAAETNGPDRFDIRVLDIGRVDQIQILEAPGPGGAYTVGKPYTLSVTGDHLDNATLSTAIANQPGLTLVPAPLPAGATSATVTESKSARIGVRFDVAGQFQLTATDFFDRNMSPAPVGPGIWDYEGSGFLFGRALILPVVTSLSPQTPSVGSTVTITGPRLIVPHYFAGVLVKPRYGTSPPHVTTTVSGNNLVFSAPANMRTDSITLRYDTDGTILLSRDVTMLVSSVDLPPIAVQGGTPAAFLLDTISTSGATRGLLIAGQRTLRGKFLVPNPLPSSLPLETKIQPFDPTQLTPTGPLTLSFGGTSLPVNSMRYDRGTSLPTREPGADIVTYTVNALPDTVTRDLVVRTPFGSTTVSNVLYLPPPTVSAIRHRVGSGQTVLVTDGKLFRGSSYEIAGSAIIVPVGSTVVPTATVRLNGADIRATSAGTTPASLLITIPTGATSGTLTLQTLAGSTTAGSFVVQDAPTAVAIAGMQVSPVDVVGGAAVTGTVALNATIPPGTTAGNIVLTQPAADPAVILPPPVPITANPTTFQIATHAVNTVHTVAITASGESGASGTNSAFATIRVHPPAPTSLTFAGPAIETPTAFALVGGQSANGLVVLNGTASFADSVRVTLTSSDPTTVVVPPSALVSSNAAQFRVTTQVVPSARTVTITATSDGRTVTAALRVSPPFITSLSPSSSSPIIGAAQVPISVGLNFPVPSPQPITIACTGEGLTCPSSASITGSSASFNVNVVEVPTPRTVTITTTLNDVARSTTLSLQPFGVQSMVTSPTSVAAGVGSSLTIQLNRAISGSTSQLLTLTSSDTSVAKIPSGGVFFEAGQITKLVSITTRSPQSQPKTVTITATGSRNTTLGPATITASTTLTVTP